MEENSGRSSLSSESLTSEFYGALVVGTPLNTCGKEVYLKNNELNGIKEQNKSSLEW